MRVFDQIKVHTRRRADVTTGVYLGPYGSADLARMRYPGGEVEFVARGNGQTFAPGTLLPLGSTLGGPGRVILREPAPGKRGASRRPIVSTQSTVAVPTITRLEPETFAPGDDHPAKLVGTNLEAFHRVRVVRYVSAQGGWIHDLRFTVHDQVHVSAEEITFLLDVAPEVPNGYVFACALETFF